MSVWNKFSIATSSKPWMPDSESDTCLLCHSPWTVRLRRHHCRVCCRLVCSKCSDHFVELDADGVAHRVCEECFPELEVHSDYPDGGKYSQAVTGGEALFKIVIHQVRCIFPIPVISQRADPPPPPWGVYCVVSTADDNTLKTTKTRPFDSQQQYKATFEEATVVKADLSKTCESYLVFRLYNQDGRLVGKSRTSLCGFTGPSQSRNMELLDRDMQLPCCHFRHCLTITVARMDRLPPLDLPMYQVAVPHATSLSTVPLAVRW